MVDPYEWLGVPKNQRPPTYYQLLALTSSADEAAIEAAANRQLGRLEAHRAGPNAASADRLAAEIAEARDTLMDPERRQLYDILAPDPDDPAPPPPLPASAYIDDDPSPPPPAPSSPPSAWWETATPEESPVGNKDWWKAPPPPEPVAPPPPLPRPVAPQTAAATAVAESPARRPIPVPLIAGGLAVVLLLASGGAYLLRKSGNSRSTSTEVASAEPEPTPAAKPAPGPAVKPGVELPPVIGPMPAVPPPRPVVEPKPAATPKADTGPRKLRGHLSAVVGVASGSNGHVYSIGDDRALRHWIGDESTVLHTFGSPGVGVAVFDDGRRVAACDSFAIALIDPTKPTEKKTFESPRGGVRSLAMSNDGRTILTGLSDGFLRAWKVETGKFDEWQVFPRGDVHALALAADGRVLVAGADGAVGLWQLAGQKKLFAWTPHKAGTASINLSPDGTRAALGGADGVLAVHDLAGRKDVFRIPAHQGAVTAVVWDADGKRLATVGVDGMARLWDADTGKASRWSHPLEGRGTCAALQARGDRLLVGTVAGAVWDVPLPTTAKAPDQLPVIKAPAEPLAIPSAEAVRAAAEGLRKIDGPPAEAAKGLLEAALGPDMPPPGRFAAFREARAAAARADDVATAVAAARGLAAWFDVDDLKELASALGAMSSKADPAALGEAVLDAIDRAELAQRPEMVARFLEIAAAVRAPDAVTRGFATARTRLQAATAEQTRLREATAVLKANPDDPEANSTYGSYLCFGRQLWDRGLPHLVRGANPGLKQVARADIAGAKDAAGFLRIADAWYAVAGGADSRTRKATLARAKAWADRVAAGKPDAVVAGKAKSLLEAIAKLDATPTDPAIPFSLPPVALRRGYDSVDFKVQGREWVTEGDTYTGVDGIRLGNGDPVARSLFDLLPGSRITFTIKPDGRDVRVICAGQDVTLPAAGKAVTLVLSYTGEELRFTTTADGGEPAERVAAVPPANRGPVAVTIRLAGEAKSPTGTLISAAVVRGPVQPAVPKPE